jgi:hypothetical protein
MIKFKRIPLSHLNHEDVYVSAYVTDAGNVIKLVADEHFRKLTLRSFDGSSEVYEIHQDSLTFVSGHVTSRWADSEVENLLSGVVEQRNDLLFAQ